VRLFALIFACCLLFSVPSGAQDVANMPFTFVSPKAPKVDPEVEHHHPAMWRLQTTEVTLIFLGSIHMLPPGLLWQDSRVKEALASADSVVFEVDMEAIRDPVFAQQLIAAGTLPAGQTLDQILSIEQYTQLNAICVELGVPIAAINNFKPGFAVSLLSILHMEANGFDQETGVDEVLERAALAASRQVLALETTLEQLEALLVYYELSPDEVMANVAREYENSNYLDDMLKAWLSGDVEALAHMFIEEIKRYPGLYEVLLLRRNTNWIAPLERMINEGGNYLVVAGVAHFIGEDSVINMLRAKGYAVERF